MWITRRLLFSKHLTRHDICEFHVCQCIKLGKQWLLAVLLIVFSFNGNIFSMNIWLSILYHVRTKRSTFNVKRSQVKSSKYCKFKDYLHKENKKGDEGKFSYMNRYLIYLESNSPLSLALSRNACNLIASL